MVYLCIDFINVVDVLKCRRVNRFFQHLTHETFCWKYKLINFDLLLHPLRDYKKVLGSFRHIIHHLKIPSRYIFPSEFGFYEELSSILLSNQKHLQSLCYVAGYGTFNITSTLSQLPNLTSLDVRSRIFIDSCLQNSLHKNLIHLRHFGSTISKLSHIGSIAACYPQITHLTLLTNFDQDLCKQIASSGLKLQKLDLYIRLNSLDDEAVAMSSLNSIHTLSELSIGYESQKHMQESTSKMQELKTIHKITLDRKPAIPIEHQDQLNEIKRTNIIGMISSLNINITHLHLLCIPESKSVIFDKIFWQKMAQFTKLEVFRINYLSNKERRETLIAGLSSLSHLRSFIVDKTEANIKVIKTRLKLLNPQLTF